MLSLADEGRAAGGDRLDRVGDGGSVCPSDIIESFRQFRRDRIPQILEVGIEGAF